MLTVAWVLVLVLSMLCSLDRTAVGQLQLGRPLVCASVAGYLLNIFPLALQLGLMLELLWLMRLPVGAAVAPDDTSAAIGGVVLLKLFTQSTPQQDMVVLVVVGMVVVAAAEVGQRLDIHTRHANEKRFHATITHLADIHWAQLERTHLSCLIPFALSALISTGVVVLVGSGVLLLCQPVLSAFSGAHFEQITLIFPVVGIAATMAVLQVRRTLLLFVGGFAVTYCFLHLVGY